MRIRLSSAVFVAFTLATLPAFGQQLPRTGEEPLPIERAYKHLETNVILPRNIADAEINTFKDYGSPELGVSLRYWSEIGERTDAYIYHLGIENLVDDEEHTKIHGQIELAFEEIQLIEKEYKIYADVKPSSKVIERTYKLGPDSITVISLPVNFTVPDNPNSSIEPGPKDSFIAVAIFRGYFFKLRRTVPADPENPKANQEAVEEFIDEWAKLIVETPQREDIRQQAQAFLAAPFSKKNLGAPAKILNYVTESELVSVSITPHSMPWLTVDDYPGGESLLAAFLAGNIESQFERLLFEDHAYAGTLAALELYQDLKARQGAPPIEKMEKFLKLEAEGKLEQLLKPKEEPEEAE
ncbi:MAG: hypothetical protein ACI8UO_002056 [Verrucomicrobiales bacterium]|jgi:hypothetical protein